MQQHFLDNLKFGNFGERLQAWKSLPLQTDVSHGVLSLEDRQTLHEILCAERDDDIRCQGMLMMLRFGSSVAAAVSERRAGRTLDAWFSRLFQKRSALFGITEGNYARRDEDALVHVARRFPPWMFQNTDVLLVPLDDDAWLQMLLDRGYETILVMGRLCLFGGKAVDVLHGDHLHLDFPMRNRPPRLKRGQLHDKYHCIRESCGLEEPCDHRASDLDHVRTDYGMVQVYPIFNGRNWITVVMCAGCSSLGTLAAARWLAYDLGRSQDTTRDMPIPEPQGIKPQSRMEALVRVTAATTTLAWQPSQIELLRLYVDDVLWSPDDSQWHNTKAREIKVVVRKGKPVALFLDGKKAPFLTTSQRFRLAVAVMLGVHKSQDGTIPLDALVRDKGIWDGRKMPTSTVKQRLHNLNNDVLQRTLIIGERVGVNANVTVVGD